MSFTYDASTRASDKPDVTVGDTYYKEVDAPEGYEVVAFRTPKPTEDVLGIDGNLYGPRASFVDPRLILQAKPSAPRTIDASVSFVSPSGETIRVDDRRAYGPGNYGATFPITIPEGWEYDGFGPVEAKRPALHPDGVSVHDEGYLASDPNNFRIFLRKRPSASPEKGVSVPKTVAAPPSSSPSPTYTLVLQNQQSSGDFLRKNVCGTGQENSFKFDVEISSQSLDSQGFVVDAAIREDLRSFLTSYGLTVASCETIAGSLIIRILANHATDALSVTARVYNATGYVDVAWVSGQTLPQGVRTATQREISAERAVPAKKKAERSIC